MALHLWDHSGDEEGAFPELLSSSAVPSFFYGFHGDSLETRQNLCKTVPLRLYTNRRHGHRHLVVSHPLVLLDKSFVYLPRLPYSWNGPVDPSLSLQWLTLVRGLLHSQYDDFEQAKMMQA